MVYIHSETLHIYKRWQNPSICDNMDNLESIILSEISLPEKGKHYMFSLICDI